IVVESGGREVDRWVQPPLGWRVRDIDLGEASGPVALVFRAHGEPGDATAVAVDWVEIAGAGRLWPSGSMTGRLLLFLLGPPLVAALHPFHYSPDVDSRARFVEALRVNPSLLVDPTQPWQRRGDVTREIGGQKVPIPYAMVFHATAWPLTAVLDDVTALKTVAV